VTPEQTEVFAALGEQIAEYEGPGLTMVAIDGVDGAGKTRFADGLQPFVTPCVWAHPPHCATILRLCCQSA